MTDLYGKQVLTPEQLQAIGHVAIESALLEVQLDQFLKTISKANPLDLDRMVLAEKLNALYSIANSRLKDCDILNKFDYMYKKGREAVTKRNRIIHGLWKQGHSQAIVYLPDEPKQILTAENVFGVANALVSFQTELAAFHDLHLDALATSRGKSFPLFSLLCRILGRIQSGWEWLRLSWRQLRVRE